MDLTAAQVLAATGAEFRRAPSMPPPGGGPVIVQRRVSHRGSVVVATQRVHVGMIHARKIDNDVPGARDHQGAGVWARPGGQAYAFAACASPFSKARQGRDQGRRAAPSQRSARLSTISDGGTETKK
jgi:hypothetical protein